MATRITDTTQTEELVYYHLVDPSGSSLTLSDAQGAVAGRVLYDPYGTVLSHTLSTALTTALAATGVVTESDTGLVYLGNGRYYDPYLGRPLQPNPAGGAPAVPQSLNRYAATPLGQPGVAEAAVQTSFTSQFLADVGTTLLSNAAGTRLNHYANYYGYLYLNSSRQVIQNEYRGLFRQLNATNRSVDAFRSNSLVRPLGRQQFELATGQIIDLRSFPILKRHGQLLERYFVSQDNGLKQFLRSPWGELGATFALDLVLAIPELLAPWQNPYFSNGQRVAQGFVTFGGVVAGTGVGAWVANAAITAGFGGPATFVTVTVAEIAVIVLWDGIVKPTVSFVTTSFGQRDPYQEYRNLKPLGGHQ